MRRAWRSFGYLTTGARTGVAAWAVLALLVMTAAITAGVPAHGRQPAWAAVQATAVVERRRAGTLLGIPVSPLETEVGPVPRRSAGWLLVQALTGLPIAFGAWLVGVLAGAGALTPLIWWALPAGEQFAFVVPVSGWAQALTGPPLLAAAAFTALWWGLPVAARAHARACRAVLAPSPAALLTERVRQLTTSRAESLDAHAAELRRIERDLHDGAQARLAAIAIQLGVAQHQRTVEPQLADALIEKARLGIEQALVEVRAVARSAYPPVLADRGLPGAVHALVVDCPVPLYLTAQPLARLPAAVEGAAYFVIAEALANMARHSAATRGIVELGHSGDRLVLTVTDNGVGGADPSGGTGLDGIRRRVTALDGSVDITSPPGGPTRVRAELPCAW